MDKKILALVCIVTVFLIIMTSFTSVAGVKSDTILSSKNTEKIKNEMILEYSERLKEVKTFKELLPDISKLTHLFQPEINSYFQKIVKNLAYSSNECICETSDTQEWYPLLLCASLLYSYFAILFITVFIGVLVNGTKILDKIFWDKFVPFIGVIFVIMEIFMIIFNCPFAEQYQIIYEEVKTIATNSENLFSHEHFDIIFSKFVNLIEIG